jgi:Protein of unknown function (DUF1572)
MKKETYLQMAIREFKRMKALGDGALAQTSSEHFFAVLSEGDNSIAVIVKHVGGNLLSRWTDFLTSDGEKPGRSREVEFTVMAGDTQHALLQQWESGWLALFSALDPLADADLERTITIRGEPLSVLQAVNRQLTHYSYHIGQIVYLAKHFAGDSWRSLSIPRGKSEQFNASPTKYVEPA